MGLSLKQVEDSESAENWADYQSQQESDTDEDSNTEDSES
jgi:hypothetical protein